MVLILVLTSTTFSWAAPRYRYPIDPLIYILAVATGATVVGWCSRAARMVISSATRTSNDRVAANPTLGPANEPGTSR